MGSAEETAWWGRASGVEQERRARWRINLKSLPTGSCLLDTPEVSGPYSTQESKLPQRCLLQMEIHASPGLLLPIMKKTPPPPLIGRPQKPHPCNNDDDNGISNGREAAVTQPRASSEPPGD